MNTIDFHKYQGTGNDFIIIDARRKDLFLTKEHIASMCDRKFGIGADGLMLLVDSDLDFGMRYFNSDGSEGSMCGNGGRCIIKFASDIGSIDNKCRFSAPDGTHYGYITETDVYIGMNDVKEIISNPIYYYLNTGAPHCVILEESPFNIDVAEMAQKWRYHKDFQPTGTNVDFISVDGNNILVSTFEKGVEDETLSCGTGVVASSIIAHKISDNKHKKYYVKTKGGNLNVSFEYNKGIYSNIILGGSAEKVFSGTYSI